MWPCGKRSQHLKGTPQTPQTRHWDPVPPPEGEVGQRVRTNEGQGVRTNEGQGVRTNEGHGVRELRRAPPSRTLILLNPTEYYSYGLLTDLHHPAPGRARGRRQTGARAGPLAQLVDRRGGADVSDRRPGAGARTGSRAVRRDARSRC